MRIIVGVKTDDIFGDFESYFKEREEKTKVKLENTV